ncbi:MAG: DUF1998 domain-containing protein [Bacillota bacterium]
MPSGPVRRAQLIAPFGVGAMIVVRDGTSLISGGLDHWYEYEDGDNDPRKLDLEEFKIEEWRLQRQLRVDHFRLPPDYRKKRPGEQTPNCYLNVPFLRFPLWHFCPACNRLEKFPLSMREIPRCTECAKKGKKRIMVQVPFVAMCEHGHIQDFPWREWVHRSSNPACDKPMRLIATGGASLSGQVVKCECGVPPRSLAQITAADIDRTTYLSKNLDSDKSKTFYCQGKRLWLGTDEGEYCPGHLRGSLRSASNVYYAQVRSSIYLPRGTGAVPAELVTLLEQPPLATLIKLLSGVGTSVTPDVLRLQYPDMVRAYSDEQLVAALRIVQDENLDSGPETAVAGDDWETAYRRAEFNVLRTPRNEEMLRIREAELDAYERDIIRFFTRILLVSKLRETRALAGFTRVYPQNSQTLEELRARMWRTVPPENEFWLPACLVFGEGIFLELDESTLQEWERRDDVVRRVQPLAANYRRLQAERRLQDRPVEPRYVLLHTLAHLLMNRLTFECGYSSASLRERIYMSSNPDAPMAGVLIYTAAGDSEGTMGGLVRMGKVGYLEPLIRRSLEGALWCSADPVCMEMGASGGQGPESCNLAACHNCALVPETACEDFNRFLDRALVVGDVINRNLGFFTLG